MAALDVAALLELRHASGEAVDLKAQPYRDEHDDDDEGCGAKAHEAGNLTLRAAPVGCGSVVPPMVESPAPSGVFCQRAACYPDCYLPA